MSHSGVTEETVQADTAGRAARTLPPSALLNVAAVLIFLGGFVAAAAGAWFLVGEHPFHREGGYSKELGMTRAQVEAVNPEIAHWTIHVSDQVGSVSLGWGVFLMTLSVLGVRRGERTAWIALWLGGLPTLLFASFGEVAQFGTWDTGSILSMAVFLLFLAGMLLPARYFLRTGSAA